MLHSSPYAHYNTRSSGAAIHMYKKLLRKVYIDEQTNTLEYLWVFIVVFFLVLFLSQALFVWIVGSIKFGFVWILLALWSLIASYYLLFGNSHKLFKSTFNKVKNIFRGDPSSAEQIDISRSPDVEKLVSKPPDERSLHVHFDVLEKKFEQKAHDMGALISSEGLKLIMSFGGGAENILIDVIEKGKSRFPRFDGWVVLNKSQVEDLISNHKEERVPFPVVAEALEVEEDAVLREEFVNQELSQPPEGEDMAEEKAVKESYRTKNTRAPINLPTGDLQSKNASATATFISLLCDGDDKALFTFIRELRQGPDSTVYSFITDSILILDRVHEHRVDGVGYVDQSVLEKCRCFSNEEIEEIIAILVRSIDHRYKLPEIGVKLSLVRAMEYVKKHRKD